ncbi:unnamed protein product [Calicophoron daubneyi]|uniref:TPX2 C-terminal domain-containing protein n=1 Tax=Calicophoron daubneyi TaxID=300641 RepID=A0AAV2TMN0_CALDB
MADRPRKSHLMVTRLDKSLGFGSPMDNSENNLPLGGRKSSENPSLDFTTRSVCSYSTRNGDISSKLNTSKVTIPKPFSFEDKDSELLRKRKEIQEQAVREAVRLASSFRAQPMRVGSPDRLPPPIRRPSTHSQPFFFHTEERMEVKRSRLQNSIQSEESSFNLSRAKSPSVLRRSPFYPKPVERPPLVCITPNLATTRRAIERGAYDRKLRERRESLEKKLEAERRIQEAKEREELKVLRRELVHKSNPIRRYKSVRLPSPKPLTVARSPKFHYHSRPDHSSNE